MDLLQQFKQHIREQNLFQPKDMLLLAVSGGVDSVVLCALCKQAGFHFSIAHCNFQLRGAESDRDEKFVTELAKTFGVKLLVKKFETEQYAKENKMSIQVAARSLRYAWFNECLHLLKTESAAVAAGQQPFAYWLLTAHHAGDNIETLLMNFFKGTGIMGLQGIPPKQANLIRPLLFAKKEALLEFAANNQLKYVEDSSNASDKYTRNYFRNQLIPDLQKVFPQVEENLMHNIERFNEIGLLYRETVAAIKKKLIVQKGAEIHIPVLKLQKSPALKTIVYEIIKNFGFASAQVDEVIALLKSETGKYLQSDTHRILKNRNWLVIATNDEHAATTLLIEGEGSKSFANGLLMVKKVPVNNEFIIKHNPVVAQLNAANIEFPLILRKWKPGDYFYPLGMQKKKKLSRFLIDQKLSLLQKEKIWVIEMQKKIIWIVGLRIDDRFKITDHTKEILQLTLSVTK